MSEQPTPSLGGNDSQMSPTGALPDAVTTPAAPPAAAPPPELGRFEVQGEIGRGSQGKHPSRV